MNTGFEGLDDALETTYDPDKTLEDANNSIQKYETAKVAVISETTLADKEFMELELKSSIHTMKTVLSVLQEDIKIGSQPRMFEVYATLSKSVLDGIKELRDLNMDIENLKIKQEAIRIKRMLAEPKANGSNGGNQTNVMILGGNDLFNMINSAKQNSQLNEIDAEFDVGDTSGAVY